MKAISIIWIPGRFHLDRNAKIDMKVIVSAQHQVFGHLTGTAVLDNGTELKMRDVIAAIEVVHNRY